MSCRSLFLLLAILSVACGSSPEGQKADAPIKTVVSSPVPSSTPSPTGSPTPLLAPLDIIPPTSTPVIHVIALGDTLIAIAEKFGVSLESLRAANPNVNPNALPVGATLVIPLGSTLPGEPTPTPVPLRIRQTTCYPTREGGLWCLALIVNDYAETVENLSILFVLQDENGQEISRQVAFAPLDIVPPGRAIAATAFFPAPTPVHARAAARILTAYRLLASDTRYLPALARNVLVKIDWDGRSAHLSGLVVLETADVPARKLWILAVAYDVHDNAIGVRRWEAAQEVDQQIPFAFSVYSLSAPIARVELLVEAQR